MQIIEQESKLNAEKKYFFKKIVKPQKYFIKLLWKRQNQGVFFQKTDLFRQIGFIGNFFGPKLNIFSILLQRRLYLWEVVLVYLIFRIALPLTRQIIKSMGNAFLYVFHYFNWLALVHIILTSTVLE